VHKETYKTINEVSGAIHCLVDNFLARPNPPSGINLAIANRRARRNEQKSQIGFYHSCGKYGIKVDDDYGEGFFKLSQEQKYDLLLTLTLRLKQGEYTKD